MQLRIEVTKAGKSSNYKHWKKAAQKYTHLISTIHPSPIFRRNPLFKIRSPRFKRRSGRHTNVSFFQRWFIQTLLCRVDGGCVFLSLFQAFGRRERGISLCLGASGFCTCVYPRFRAASISLSFAQPHGERLVQTTEEHANTAQFYIRQVASELPSPRNELKY